MTSKISGPSALVGEYEWQGVAQAIIDAANEMATLRPFGRTIQQLMADSGQENTVNQIFHSLVVTSLHLSGAADKSTVPGNHDVALWGYPVEIKTTTRSTIVSNRSYAMGNSEERLLIAINFAALRGVVVPLLMRAGFSGPSDYQAKGQAGQIAEMTYAGLNKLTAFWALPIEDMPARLVPGFADGRLRSLGDPETIADLRIAVARSRDGHLTQLLAAATPATIAASLGWYTLSASIFPFSKRTR